MAGASLIAMTAAVGAQDAAPLISDKIRLVPVSADTPSGPDDTDAARISVAVPAGPLEPALTALAGQAGFRLAYRTALTEGLTTRGVEGAFRPLDALAELLAGTGLTYRAAGPRRSPSSTRATSSSAASRPPPSPWRNWQSRGGRAAAPARRDCRRQPGR
ncbi:hypothetical protein GCM10025880_40650 [Methylorubrum aminovorans]|uniref:STN domain-containing protein n=1 Tax=Methylorubrum aminovorans TaxID=269069 RepID=UPI0023EA24F0|nr:hypothetical protein GCM10025880_40650 [Methylorubrum aminovorans]